MAKKPQKPKRRSFKQTEFYEALSATFPAASKPQIIAPPRLKVAKPAPKIESKAIGLARSIARDLPAIMTDANYYTRKLVRTLISRRARVLYLVLAMTGIVASSIIAARFINKTYIKYANEINNPALLLANKNTGTTLLDRNGQVLYQVYGATTRDMVTINDVPKNLINATLAAEDPDFYKNPAISIRGTTRALYQDIVHHSASQGGSTLTQQLVKSTLLTPDRTLFRKAQEVALSMVLEHRYSKDKLMELYLNGVYYGQGSYGVGTAAQTYFNKDIKNLTLGESATLAGLPLGPSRFDPAVWPNVAKDRRNFVLDRMQNLGYITTEQANTAKQEPINASARQINIQAPGFAFYALDQLRAQYGDDAVERGGLTVYTTLDLNKQKLGESIVQSQIGRLSSRHVTDGALLSLDPKTGEILTMVGSSNYDDPNFGAINMTTSPRQPGSSIKPLVYLDAFTKGYTPATVVDDLPVTFPDGTGVYQPHDYDMKWRGKVTLRTALGNSLNVPAIHVLQHVGVPDGLSFMRNLGITTLNDAPSNYGLSLTLGSAEVKMVDMAGAYGVFASGGKSVTPTGISRVLDRTGHNITKPQAASKQLIDPRAVSMLTSILSDNNARQMEFGLSSPLHLSRPAAAKTGTTTDWKDNWTAGYTPDVVTVAWAGNADDSSMINVDGITGAAPIWHDYMEAILASTPIHDFVQPPGMSTVHLCPFDGGLATAFTPNSITETIPTEMIPKKPCAAPPPPPQPQPQPQPTLDQPTPPTPPVSPQPLPPTPPQCHGNKCIQPPFFGQ